MKPIIEVKNIGKKYTINHERGGYIALRDILAGALRNPFSFLKRNIKGVFETKEPFWALKDVSFTVNKGEVVGIIGRNGAGKSTLLKILSRITPPTTGEIKIHGTVGSLLEVGTGFHPELTGRENIFLNGAILGMKKAEIVQKFDEIVAFAGIEKFLDTPVKYYSSGMYVRLAFSVAAHLDPDILIVDEVLAVGDAEFQKKCLGKMEEITQQEGRTILFVSHNMGAIKNLCKQCIFLDDGKIVAAGKTSEIIEKYSSQMVNLSYKNTQREESRFSNIIKEITITNKLENKVINSSDQLRLSVTYDTKEKESLSDGRLVITITNSSTQQVVLMLDSYVTGSTWSGYLPAKGILICETDDINLTEGTYEVTLDFIINGTSKDYIKHASSFNVISNISDYDYKNNPDKNTIHRMIRHNFYITR